MTTGSPFKTLAALAAALGIVWGTGGPLRAANPVIYEPFDYAAGSRINGQNGGIGFAGPWQITNNNPIIQAASVSWGALQTSGNYLYGTALTCFYRPIGTTLSDAGLMADGATLWFSYVEDTYGQNMTNLDFNFALATDPLVGKYPTQTDYNNRMNLRNNGFGIGVSNSTTTVTGAYWLDDGDGDGYGEVHGTNTTLVLNNTSKSRVFVVGKIVWGANAAANETITLYTPGTNLTMGNPILTLTTPALNQSQFDTLAIEWKDTPSIDEIRFGATYEDVIGERPILKLRVDPVTGQTKILGNAARTVTINFFQVTSAAGSLDAAGWTSLADQDFEGSGPPAGTGDGWEEAGGARNVALAEAFLLGDSTINVAQAVSLGQGYNVDVDARDLVFKYRTDTGDVLDGIVEYVTSVAPGDANADGVVDAADYVTLKRNVGKTSGAKFREGDFDFDGDVDFNDLAILRAAMGGGGGQMQVPEPGTLGLLACGAAAMAARRKRRRR
jgi:hypothetical protein